MARPHLQGTRRGRKWLPRPGPRGGFARWVPIRLCRSRPARRLRSEPSCPHDHDGWRRRLPTGIPARGGRASDHGCGSAPGSHRTSPAGKRTIGLRASVDPGAMRSRTAWSPPLPSPPWPGERRSSQPSGPASSDPEMLRAMIDAGMDMARVSLSHAPLQDALALIDRIRSVAAESGHHVGVLADLPGPKVRAAPFVGEEVRIVDGTRVELVSAQDADTEHRDAHSDRPSRRRRGARPRRSGGARRRRDRVGRGRDARRTRSGRGHDRRRHAGAARGERADQQVVARIPDRRGPPAARGALRRGGRHGRHLLRAQRRRHRPRPGRLGCRRTCAGREDRDPRSRGSRRGDRRDRGRGDGRARRPRHPMCVRGRPALPEEGDPRGGRLRAPGDHRARRCSSRWSTRRCPPGPRSPT